MKTVINIPVSKFSTHTHGYGVHKYHRDCYPCPGCGGQYDGYDYGGMDVVACVCAYGDSY
jgi:hypothetical protein